jgi:hypothetical protein
MVPALSKLPFPDIKTISIPEHALYRKNGLSIAL